MTEGMQFRIFYKFLGNPVSALVASSTAEAARAEFEKQHPQIQTVYDIELVQPTWMMALPSRKYVILVNALLADPALRVFTDAPSKSCPQVEHKYAAITGLSVSWKRCEEDSKADKERYAARAIIRCSSEIPLQGLSPKPGYIASMPLFWSLVEAGWRLDGSVRTEAAR
jgi:hypothetical protein